MSSLIKHPPARHPLTHTHSTPLPHFTQVSAINTAMSSLIKTLGVFPSERQLVQRERRRAGYSLIPYLGWVAGPGGALHLQRCTQLTYKANVRAHMAAAPSLNP